MIDWNTTRDEENTITAIMNRAVKEGLIEKDEAANLRMDLAACHSMDIKLDFEKLLDFPRFDLAHDLGGIRRHIDRETGKLGGCFLPRCALLANVPDTVGNPIVAMNKFLDGLASHAANKAR